ncbi:FAD-binding monooxygenase [Myroides odoratimimus]|uniref:FAD-dependent monooxygenase n=1 Tax=Myroides odoratimimus TaxID=76832 RepID=UPI000724123B|nr:FAD-dependent monooxygenase [Myroides odoratimimus]GAQ14654.1 FAD-binding monooxygenase [Myroides odoratimimus]STZ49480.1 2,4-dichlorophenol 6-monooxygenase [Myroides odoratimimus]
MENINKPNKTSVLIIGGGITGLTAALLLERCNIDFILVEKHKTTSILPRARTIDIRTMEIYRELGLSENLREAGKELAPSWGILRGNNLKDALAETDSKIIGKITYPSELENLKHLGEKSPEIGCRCTQDLSEKVLFDKLIDNKQDLRFYHQMLSFKQHGNTTTSIIQNRKTGDQYTIEAQYIIAADGANSPTRKQLNIATYGNGSWTNLLNIYFKADLSAIVKGKEFSQLLIDTEEITGFLLSINNKNKWAFHLKYNLEKQNSDSFTPENILSILYKVLGYSDIEISVLNLSPWQLTVRIAKEIAKGNVFIVGDAAHTMTPYAGKGASAGIQDVHNLIWKLKQVLEGKANKKLLNTYDIERQNVGAFYANLSGELADDNGLVRDKLLLEKGNLLIGLPDYSYNSTAINNKQELPTEFISGISYTGVIGTRLPHMWLDKQQTVSTLDWINYKFTLIVNQYSDYWIQAWAETKQELNIDIELHHFLNSTVLDKWTKLTNSTLSDAILVRPDGFVAARLSTNDPEHNLLNCLKEILSIK